MSKELPDHLKPVRDILMDSANGPEADEVPGAPEDLLDDLEKSLTGTPIAPVPVSQPGFFEKLRHLLATPAFGAMAALVVVLFIAVPLFKGGHGFRSGADPQASVAPVVLLGVDDETFERLSSNGLFDPEALVRVTSSEEATAVQSPKVIVDFTEGTLRAYDAGGNEFYRHAIKTEKSLPSDIARALSELPQAGE